MCAAQLFSDIFPCVLQKNVKKYFLVFYKKNGQNIVSAKNTSAKSVIFGQFQNSRFSEISRLCYAPPRTIFRPKSQNTYTGCSGAAAPRGTPQDLPLTANFGHPKVALKSPLSCHGNFGAQKSLFREL
jgi:hypothetical protein